MMANFSDCGDHYIEEHVKVYLVWDDGDRRWAIDPIIDPEYGELDGLIDPDERGAECDCPRTDTLPGPGYDQVPQDEREAREGHEAALDRASEERLPDAVELLGLLADHLGYHLIRCSNRDHAGRH